MATTIKKAAVNAVKKTGQIPSGGPATDPQLAEALKVLAQVIEIRPTDELKPNPRNPRRHGAKKIDLLAANIKVFGFIGAIIIDEDGMILAGNAQLEAAKRAGLRVVPTIRVTHLSANHKRAFVLAHNRLAELAEWDEEILRFELAELSILDLDFEFEVTGFDTVDLDRLDDTASDKAAAPELVEEPDREHPAVCAPGDLWQLGPHRLLCGSALEDESYKRLLGDERAQLVFSDPPYNVPINGHVCGLGAVRHAAFKMASGEMSEEQFIEFLQRSMRFMADYSIDGALHFICMDWRHDLELQLAARPVYGRLKQLIVWNKTNAGMGTFYRSKHELIFVFKVGSAPHINNFGLGARGRYRTNVWDYPGVNTFRRGRMEELEAHPTVKALAMVVDALKDCSSRRGIVLDPFVGSGTTLLAAEKTGRVGRGIELDPHYVDVSIRRWQDLTGQAAIHVGSGRSFDELAAGAAATASEGGHVQL